MLIKVGIVNEPYPTRVNGPTGLRKITYKPLHKRFLSSLGNRYRGWGLCISDAYVRLWRRTCTQNCSWILFASNQMKWRNCMSSHRHSTGVHLNSRSLDYTFLINFQIKHSTYTWNHKYAIKYVAVGYETIAVNNDSDEIALKTSKKQGKVWFGLREIKWIASQIDKHYINRHATRKEEMCQHLDLNLCFLNLRDIALIGCSLIWSGFVFM